MLTAAAIAAALALPAPETPAALARDALADARTLPADARPHTRYLSLWPFPEADRGDLVRWLTFHLWSLSKEAEPGRPRRVGRALVRIDLRD